MRLKVALLYIGIFLLVASVFAFTTKAQVIDLSAGQLPVLVSTNDLKVAELKCPSNAVLVIQVKNPTSALVSCPPDFLLAPAATLLSADYALQAASPLATVDLMPTQTVESVDKSRSFSAVLSVRPNGLMGVDTSVSEFAPSLSYADDPILRLDSREGFRSYGLLLFNIYELPVDSIVTRATLTIYNSAMFNRNISFSAHAMLPNNKIYWNEFATWDYPQPQIVRWAGDLDGLGGEDAGGGVADTDYISASFGKGIYQADTALRSPHVIDLDISQIQLWRTEGNHGFMLQTHDGESFGFYSSDVLDPSLRPRLDIYYVERY